VVKLVLYRESTLGRRQKRGIKTKIISLHGVFGFGVVVESATERARLNKRKKGKNVLCFSDVDARYSSWTQKTLSQR